MIVDTISRNSGSRLISIPRLRIAAVVAVAVAVVAAVVAVAVIRFC